MDSPYLPFELRKASIENSLNKESYLDVIEKSHVNKYLRKEGDRYIYENAQVKTPHGHGRVISVKRHPIDIDHIQSVKVNVNDKEHDLSPNQVSSYMEHFSKEDIGNYNDLKTSLSNSGLFPVSEKDKYTINSVDDVSRVIDNLKRPSFQAKLSEEKKAKLNTILETGSKLDSSMKHYHDLYHEADIQRQAHEKTKPVDWEGMKEWTVPLKKAYETLGIDIEKSKGPWKRVKVAKLSSGKDLYDDPFHEAHDNFTTKDHDESAAFHNNKMKEQRTRAQGLSGKLAKEALDEADKNRVAGIHHGTIAQMKKLKSK
jgi:hypothetical protein